MNTTRRRRGDRALRQVAEAVERSLAVFEVALDGTVLRANDNLLTLLDRDREEVEGHPHRVLMGETPGIRAEHEALRFAEGRVEVRHLSQHRADGATVRLRVAYNPCFDDQGNVEKVIALASEEPDLPPSADRATPADQHASLEAQHGSLQAQHASLRAQHASLQAQHASLQARYAELERQHAQVAEAEVQRAALATQHAELEAKCFEESRRRTEVEAELGAYARAMAEAVRVFEALAKGDLRPTIEGDYTGDLGRLKAGVNGFVAELGRVLGQASTITRQLASAASQVRGSSEEFAESAAKQGEAVQQSAAAITQTTSQVRANAESASVADRLARETSEAAVVGRRRMADLDRAMSAIERSSSEMASILRVIDEIAFQTNLLALNAAAEAARAGKYGRGFAVVAKEVRSLAERSARAAKETEAIIDTARGHVGEGLAIRASTDQALGEIVANVGAVRDLVGNIASASQEQTDGLAGVDAAMRPLHAGAETAASQCRQLTTAAE